MHSFTVREVKFDDRLNAMHAELRASTVLTAQAWPAPAAQAPPTRQRFR